MARVPLLRLAQLAVLGKEFHAAYHTRQETQRREEASAPSLLICPLFFSSLYKIPRAYEDVVVVQYHISSEHIVWVCGREGS